MDDWVLAQAAQRDPVVSHLGDLQKSPGHGPGQPAFGVPAGAGVGADDFQRPLPNSAVLWACDHQTPESEETQPVKIADGIKCVCKSVTKDIASGIFQASSEPKSPQDLIISI